MSAWPQPITLTRPEASLVPLSQLHAADLAKASADGDLHKLWYTTVPAPEIVAAEIDRRLALQSTGDMIPFSVLDPNGCAVGMTTFMNIDRLNKRLEIGSTWYRASVQRSGINTACKRLLLAHAFDDGHCNAIEFRTHRMNRQSRNAIERLGAKFDGILRNHMVLSNGTLRDTAVYSITRDEWPTIRANLDQMLEHKR